MLDNLRSSIPERNLVSYTLSGLTKKFQYIATTIRYEKSFPLFMEIRSILVMEEQQMELDQHHQITLHTPIMCPLLLCFLPMGLNNQLTTASILNTIEVVAVVGVTVVATTLLIFMFVLSAKHHQTK